MDRKKLQDLKILLLILPVAAVVFTSGCTSGGGGTVSFGPGVQIVTWEPDLKTQAYNSGDTVKLLLKVQNQGEFDAENVKAKLFGINLDEWGNGWSAEDDLGTLQAANEEYNTPGESKTKQWLLKAPDLEKGIEINYHPKVRVYYDYKTLATKTITVVDKTELRRIIQQGRTLPSAGPTTNTYGPLTVEITTGNFVKTGDNNHYLPINIKIRNTGSGSVSNEDTYSYGDEYDYPITVKVTLPSTLNIVEGEDCSSSGQTVEMWQGQEADITCKVSVSDVDISQDETIRVEADYRYQIDATTEVRVIGQQDTWW